MTKQQKSALCTFACFLGYLACVLASLIFAEAKGQCYTDPVTGRRICPDQVTWQSGQRSNPPGLAMAATDIRVRWSGGWGSGTAVVRLPGGGTGIVTNYHVIKGSGGQVTAINGRGEQLAGRVIAEDRPNDLALVAVDARWPIVRVATSTALPAAVSIRGFAEGQRFMARDGHSLKVMETSHHGGGPVPCVDVTTGVTFPGGTSGGGVYSRGCLVGVMWGSARGTVQFTPLAPVRRLVQRVLGPPQPPAINVNTDPRPADSGARGAHQEPTPAPRMRPGEFPKQCEICKGRDDELERISADLVERLDRLETTATNAAKLAIEIDASLDERVQSAAEIYIASRIDELKGKDGKDAAPIDLDTLAARVEAAVLAKIDASPLADNGAHDAHQAAVTALRNELAALKAKKFKVYTHTPDGVFDSESLNIGDDIHLQYVPIGQ